MVKILLNFNNGNMLFGNINVIFRCIIVKLVFDVRYLQAMELFLVHLTIIVAAIVPSTYMYIVLEIDLDNNVNIPKEPFNKYNINL